MNTDAMVLQSTPRLASSTKDLDRRTFVRLAALGVVFSCAFDLASGTAAATEGASSETLAALSDAQSAYDQAMAELSSLTQSAELTQYELDQTQASLEETSAAIADLQASISEKQAELSEAQDILAERIDASYRAGKADILSVILDATSFDDLVSRIHYAGKVSDSDAEMIQQVKDLKAELEQQESDLLAKKAEQESLLAQQQSAAASLQEQVDAMRSYSSRLSSEVTSLMSQAQAEALAAREAQYQQYVDSVSSDSSAGGTSTSAGTSSETTQGGSTTSEPSLSDLSGTSGASGSPTVSTTPTDSTYATDNGSETDVSPTPTSESTVDSQPEPDVVSDPEPSTGSDSSSSGGTGNHCTAAAEIAWNYIGVPYLWGGTTTDGFDCSGLAQYCYAQAGYSISRTTYSQIAEIQAAGNWKTSMSDLVAGDLVFPHEGHVGIYEGGGMMIHAPYEGETVKYADVYAFIGGGCPF